MVFSIPTDTTSLISVASQDEDIPMEIGMSQEKNLPSNDGSLSINILQSKFAQKFHKYLRVYSCKFLVFSSPIQVTEYLNYIDKQ